MTHSAIATAIKKRVPTVPKALAALAAMEKELASTKTYDEIKHIIREAAALNVLLGHVAEVKAQAEDTILIANRRIGEEIRKVPKASGRPAKIVTAPGKNKRADIMPGTSRARLQKLADIPVADLKAVSRDLRAAGKDATVSAVVRQITQGDKKQRRADREKQLGAKQAALPDRLYGVIYADPPWRFEPYSQDTGMDRAADNHYPTMNLAAISALAVPAAPDCVLFLWATVPMLPEAIAVMTAWGFKYKSNFVWEKNIGGTGFWNINRHELLLVGTRGNIPAPAPGDQFDSVLFAPRGKHSAKPHNFRDMIERTFPTLPRIELFAREQLAGWDVWGNEAPQEAAE